MREPIVELWRSIYCRVLHSIILETGNLNRTERISIRQSTTESGFTIIKVLFYLTLTVSLTLNPIENLRSTPARNFYANKRQARSVIDLKEYIQSSRDGLGVALLV